jgi:acetylornithine deacetylase/succinyl-diaminopimelate desuccinylase-like protein
MFRPAHSIVPAGGHYYLPPWWRYGGGERYADHCKRPFGAWGLSMVKRIDPIVTSAQIISNLQTIVSRNLHVTDNPAVVTIGAINGGNRSNIIPEAVTMLGTIRTFSAADEKMIIERVKTIATKTAEAAALPPR